MNTKAHEILDLDKGVYLDLDLDSQMEPSRNPHLDKGVYLDLDLGSGVYLDSSVVCTRDESDHDSGFTRLFTLLRFAMGEKPWQISRIRGCDECG